MTNGPPNETDDVERTAIDQNRVPPYGSRPNENWIINFVGGISGPFDSRRKITNSWPFRVFFAFPFDGTIEYNE